MCDVLHTLFEDDFSPHFEQGVEVKGRLRESLYRTLYSEEYKWRISTDGPKSFDDDAGTMDSKEHGTYRRDTSVLKRVQPPTPIEDLPGILGPPMG